MTNQVYRELEKNKMDKVASEAELDNAKKRFAEELMLYDIGSSLYNTPQKFKKPLGMRIKARFKRFLWGVVRVFGG